MSQLGKRKFNEVTDNPQYSESNRPKKNEHALQINKPSLVAILSDLLEKVQSGRAIQTADIETIQTAERGLSAVTTADIYGGDSFDTTTCPETFFELANHILIGMTIIGCIEHIMMTEYRIYGEMSWRCVM
eukprot:629645_1